MKFSYKVEFADNDGCVGARYFVTAGRIDVAIKKARTIHERLEGPTPHLGVSLVDRQHQVDG